MTEAPDGSPDELPVGPAAKRRRRGSVAGAAVATALVVGGAAVGGSAVVGDSDDTPVARQPDDAIAVDLPTSDRKAGDGGFRALLHGTLAIDENDCVYLANDDAERVYAIWPSGYTATADSADLHLFDAEGAEVARDGDMVQVRGGYGPARSAHPCLPTSAEIAHIQSEVEVTAPKPESRPDPAAGPGDPAVWHVADAAGLTASTTTLTADVQRLGCNSGVTGRVLSPVVEYSPTQVVVTFEVEADPDGGDCPGNRAVPYDVELAEPLGDRALVDGQCRPGEAAATTSHCSSGGLRWEAASGE
ncbi:hypothetical protein [Nocardioides sp. SYSU DS0663]|uniref:hypothetical protein n=1 Tax=Nocardioides sp. SYSU DS0663 TaxID=3416445 RepID=UPI003F4C39F1